MEKPSRNRPDVIWTTSRSFLDDSVVVLVDDGAMIETTNRPDRTQTSEKADVASLLVILLDVEFGATVEVDSDLFDEGHLDSLAVVELLLIIEETFGVIVDDGDVTPDNLRTVRSIAALISEPRP